MALIVVPAAGAESYCSVLAADVYHESRGNDSWANLSVEQKEQALRRATDYMEGVYGDLWLGSRATEDQTLDWPRVNASVNGYLLSSTTIPAAVVNACALLGLRASQGALYQETPTQDIQSERVGPIAVNYGPKERSQPRYQEVDDMLVRYLRAGRDQVRLERG